MQGGSFYWFDFETFGADPARDKPAQFAGVRTDMALNITGEPLVTYCKPSTDFLPAPEACLITGITPQIASNEGIVEAEFAAKVHEALSVPGTCGVGYNSIRFDDEVTRYMLYRNFYDPYEREYRNGNSRWDLIDVVRMMYALRPGGIEWPLKPGTQTPSFRLEDLSQANGLSHENAHDALSDVYATIDLAKLIKQANPKLFDYALSLRSKAKVAELLDIRGMKPLLHISSRFKAENGCCAIVLPITMHGTNANACITYDLSVDPTALLTLNAEQIKERVFSSTQSLEEAGSARLPLKLVHLNRSPMLAPAKVLGDERAGQLNIDLGACRQHWKILSNELKDPQQGLALRQKLQLVFSRQEDEFAQTDPELQLYSGGFFGEQDKRLMRQVRDAGPDVDYYDLVDNFTDARLPELLFRYCARNYPHTLGEAEQERWESFRRQCLFSTDSDQVGGMGFQAYGQRLQQLMMGEGLGSDKQFILDQLRLYGESIYPYE